MKQRNLQNQSFQPALNSLEKRAAYSLAGIYALRMLGLFMIFPVFSLYAADMENVTPLLIGLALGVYGLTQACLQIPFGMLSDRFGRKRIIIIGLIIFAAGSIVAAMAESIYGIILGRCLQGAGAIAATLMALAADLTREESRLRIMAFIGISIGVSFAIAMILGPLFASWFGLSGLFWITAALALSGIAVVYFVVPSPALSQHRRCTQLSISQFGTILKDRQLLRLDLGIFLLHMMLTATFVVFPVLLRDVAGLALMQHWTLYLPVMLLSFAVMVPFIIIAEKKQRMKRVFLASIAMLALSQLSLYLFNQTVFALAVGLFVFFTAFNVLEASLPSLAAKYSPPDKRGTTMGIYSSCQFLGAFCGGIFGGLIYGELGIEMVALFCAGLALLWFVVAASMQRPLYLTSHVLRLSRNIAGTSSEIEQQLMAVPGVRDVVVVDSEGLAYMKVDKNELDTEEFKKFSASHEDEKNS